MRIVVQKFGGTSVADVGCMRQVQQRVQAALNKGYKVVTVLSAMAGETNRLLDQAKQWSLRPDPAELDVLVSTGEQVSVALFAMLLKDNGINARSLLGFQAGIRTDAMSGHARILAVDADRITAWLHEHDVLVVAGFQGWDPIDRITTLGRGGSDTSAVALAAALKAESCDLFKDVEGIYTTDPNICAKARKLAHISYEEMLEMAGMGAKVLQIRAVGFAMNHNVPLRVRCTFNDEPGTLVTKEETGMESMVVTGIAYDKNQARVTLLDLKDTPGIAAAVFSPLAAAGVLVDMIVQNASWDGLTDITFTVPTASLDKTKGVLSSLTDLVNPDKIITDLDVAKISAIGVGMRNHTGVAAKVFETMKAERINILMISTSEIKLTCLIEEKYAELAVRSLHTAFGLDKKEE